MNSDSDIKQKNTNVQYEEVYIDVRESTDGDGDSKLANVKIEIDDKIGDHHLFIISPTKLTQSFNNIPGNRRFMGYSGYTEAISYCEFDNVEFELRLLINVNDTIGDTCYTFFDIKKSKGSVKMNIAYYIIDFSSSDINHSASMSVAEKIVERFTLHWPYSKFNIEEIYRIEVGACGGSFQSIEYLRAILFCRLQPLGDTQEFMEAIDNVTPDTISAAHSTLQKIIIQKLQSRYQGYDVDVIEMKDYNFSMHDKVCVKLVVPFVLSYDIKDTDTVVIDGSLVTYEELMRCTETVAIQKYCKSKDLSSKGTKSKLIARIFKYQMTNKKLRR